MKDRPSLLRARKLVAGLAVATVIALGLTVAAPPGAAEAACLISIQCPSPGNAAILVEAGMIVNNAGGAALAENDKKTTAPIKPKTGTGKLGWLGLAFNAIVGGAGTAWWLADNESAKGGASIKEDGIRGTGFTTDPKWTGGTQLPTSRRCGDGTPPNPRFFGGIWVKTCNVMRTQLSQYYTTNGGQERAYIDWKFESISFEPDSTWTRYNGENGNMYIRLKFTTTTPRPIRSDGIPMPDAESWCTQQIAPRTNNDTERATASSAISSGGANIVNAGVEYGSAPGKTLTCEARFRWGGNTSHPQLAYIGSGHAGEALWGAGNSVTGQQPDNTTTDRITGTSRTTVTCTGPGGVTQTIVKELSVDIKAGEDLMAPDATCPAGQVATGGQVDFAPTPTAPGAPTVWEPLTEPITPPAIIGQLPDKYPNCIQPKVCTLQLFQITSTGLVSCGSVGEYCPDWAKQDNAPALYQCKYGSYLVDLDMCSAFRDPTRGLLPNYTEDGQPIRWNDPVPTRPIGTTPTKPDGTPISVPVGGPTPGGASSESSQCYPTGWGVFNPVSWVWMPVKCALQDMFVPRPAARAAAVTRLQTAVNASALGSGIGIAAMFGNFGLSEGCGGVPWTFSVKGVSQTGRILAACPGDDLAPVAATVKGVAVPVIWTVAAMAWLRYIATIVNFVGFGNAHVSNGVAAATRSTKAPSGGSQ